MPTALRRWLLPRHIWLLAALVPLLVKILPFKHLLHLLTPSARRTPYRGVRPEQVAELVAKRLANPYHMSHRRCLRESLVVFHFLRLAGWPAVLNIGVYPPGTSPKGTKAHGWVSLDGQVLTSPPEGPVALVVEHGKV